MRIWRGVPKVVAFTAKEDSRHRDDGRKSETVCSQNVFHVVHIWNLRSLDENMNSSLSLERAETGAKAGRHARQDLYCLWGCHLASD